MVDYIYLYFTLIHLLINILDIFILLELKGDEIIPEVFDLCASIQYALTKHICTRVQRAIEFIDRTQLLPDTNRTLVN